MVVPRLLAVLATSAVIAAPAATAAPGAPDTSFGDHGRLFVDSVLGGGGEDGTGLASVTTLADGRIVVLGTARCGLSCDPGTVIHRLSADGAPDPTLSAGATPGILGIPGGDDADPVRDQLLGVALRADGGLVAGRRSRVAASLVPYGPDGGIGAAVASAVAVAPDEVLPGGRILGRAGRRVVRLTSGLAVDTGFAGGRGIALPAGLLGTVPPTVSGRSIVVGGAYARGLALWRVPRTGAGAASITTVRVPGWRRTPVFARHAVQAVAAPGGRTLLTAYVAPPDGIAGDTVIAAVDARGRREARFGVSGLARVPGVATRIAVAPGGRIVTATIAPGPLGATSTQARSRLVLSRLGPHGGRDAGFRTRVVALPRGTVTGPRVTVDGRGRILVAVAVSPSQGAAGVLLFRFRGGR